METGVAHLLEASIKLECSLEVSARGLLLYHHFMRCAAEHHYDEDMIAAGALNLSGRFYEQPIELDSLICVFYSIVNQTTEAMSSEDVAYQVIKRTLIRIDYMMIRLLEFNMTHRLAHQCLVPFLVMIFERSKNIADFRGELGRTCMRFISDFYTEQICLEYPPELIAIACIDLSLHVHGLINDLAMVPAWYMGFVCDISPDKVGVIKRLIIRLYENNTGKTLTQQVLSSQAQQFIPTQVQQVLPSMQNLLPFMQQIFPTQMQQVESMDICSSASES